jgi:hypothetical protein
MRQGRVEQFQRQIYLIAGNHQRWTNTNGVVEVRRLVFAFGQNRSGQSSGLGCPNVDFLLGFDSLGLLRKLHRQHTLGEACFDPVGIYAFW